MVLIEIFLLTTAAIILFFMIRLILVSREIGKMIDWWYDDENNLGYKKYRGEFFKCNKSFDGIFLRFWVCPISKAIPEYHKWKKLRMKK